MSKKFKKKIPSEIRDLVGGIFFILLFSAVSHSIPAEGTFSFAISLLKLLFDATVPDPALGFAKIVLELIVFVWWNYSKKQSEPFRHNA